MIAKVEGVPTTPASQFMNLPQVSVSQKGGGDFRLWHKARFHCAAGVGSLFNGSGHQLRPVAPPDMGTGSSAALARRSTLEWLRAQNHPCDRRQACPRSGDP